MKYHQLSSKNPDKNKSKTIEDEREEIIKQKVQELGENAKAIYQGFLDNGVLDGDEELKERARNKIGYDYLANRISEDEGEFLNYIFGLD